MKENQLAPNRKSYFFVPAQLLLFVLYFLLPELAQLSIPDPWPFFGKIIALSALLVLFFASVKLGKNLSPFPLPLPNSELVTSGLYRYIRHPIYSGFILLVCGIALVDESLTKLLFIPVFILFFYIKARFEEEKLKEKFAEYENYMKKSGMFLPRF